MTVYCIIWAKTVGWGEQRRPGECLLPVCLPVICLPPRAQAHFRLASSLAGGRRRSMTTWVTSRQPVLIWITAVRFLFVRVAHSSTILFRFANSYRDLFLSQGPACSSNRQQSLIEISFWMRSSTASSRALSTKLPSREYSRKLHAPSQSISWSCLGMRDANSEPCIRTIPT